MLFHSPFPTLHHPASEPSSSEPSSSKPSLLPQYPSLLLFSPSPPPSSPSNPLKVRRKARLPHHRDIRLSLEIRQGILNRLALGETDALVDAGVLGEDGVDDGQDLRDHVGVDAGKGFGEVVFDCQ